MKTIALYDKTCSLCRESKHIFEKLDWMNKVKWISLQEYEKTEHPLSFENKDLRKELHVIPANGQVKKGFYAVRHLFLHFPLSFLFGVLLFVPPAPLIGKPLYILLAKNRHKFLKRKCKDGSCSL